MNVNRRRHLNMSQKDVARRMNTTQSVVSRIESGHVENLTLRTLNRIAEALDCSVSLELRPNESGTNRNPVLVP